MKSVRERIARWRRLWRIVKAIDRGSAFAEDIVGGYYWDNYDSPELLIGSFSTMSAMAALRKSSAASDNDFLKAAWMAVSREGGVHIATG